MGGGPGGAGPSMEAPAGGGGGGGPSLDRGPSSDGGPAGAPSARGDGGDGPRGLGPGGPESRASRNDDAAERPSRSADEGPSDRGASRKSADSDRGDSSAKARRERSADDERGPSKSEKAAERAKADKADEKAAERAKSRSEEKADESQKRATTETQERAKEARESTPKADDAAKKSGDTARVAPDRAKQVQIASDKRDRVDAAFRGRHDARHRTNVGFSISVGRRLPRDWDYVPVPIAVIDIVPEYRDYVYVWVDDEYVIADPDTYEVVAVIPVSSGGYASAGGSAPCSTRIRLSDDERDLILHSVRMRDAVEVQDLDIGWSVPGNIELQRFPDPVLDEAEELSGCRYFVAEDQLAIVDPQADKVVLLIDRS